MPAERYYTPNDLVQGSIVSLVDKELHHLLHVMRASMGEEIELINGRGAIATGILEKVEKQRALIKIENVQTRERPLNEIILVQAIPRMNRLDYILEKGTELGMTQLWLFPGRHSERHKFTEQQLAHHQSICIAAMKQCGRLYLPEIKIVRPIQQWDKLEHAAYFGDVDENAPLFLNAWHGQGSALFFIGPESGFHLDEENHLKKLGAKGVKLHANILRTDTAAIAALTLMTHL